MAPSTPTSHIGLLLKATLIMLLLLALGQSSVLARESGEAAQESEQQKATREAQETAEEQQLRAEERVVVTARRRDEDVQSVPVAVSVISGVTLEDVRAKDIAVLQDYTPNISIYAGRNQSTTLTAFVRGIGQADPLWGVDPGVGLYLDDVYIARPQGALLDVFDVQRIEVLRGPQGTLYGKNTIGGAIKYISRPLTDKRDVRLALTGGAFTTRDFRGSIGGGIVKGKLRAKAAFASMNHDGYGTNLFTGRDVSNKRTNAYRVALEWLPSATVNLKFGYDRVDDTAEPKGLTRLAANLFCPLFLGESCPPLGTLFDTQSGLEPINSTHSNGYSMILGWDISPSWKFRSITAYRKSDTENNIDFDTTPARITDVMATYFDEQTSQEFQFTYTGDSKLSGVLGFFYFDGKAGGLVKNIFLEGLINGTTDGTTNTDSVALYGDGTYALTDRLALNLGLRYTHEKKNGRAFNALYADDTFEQISLVTADYDKSVTFNSLSPRIGLDYVFSNDVMGYFSLSRGFKSGGFNVRAAATFFPQSAEPFDDEKLTMGEIGVKSQFANRQLTLNLAAFYGDYTDVQVSTFTSFDSDGDGVDDAFFGNFLNAGDATVKGVELEYDWAPQSVPWLRFSGFAAYLDASPDSFLDENNDGFVDTQVITNAPKFTGAIYANFNFRALEGIINGSVGVSHRAESTLTNEGGANPFDPTQPLLPIMQPAYTILNSWIGWFSRDGIWKVTVNAVNLTDEAYLTNGYNIPVLGLLQGSYGQPRTVSATLGYQF